LLLQQTPNYLTDFPSSKDVALQKLPGFKIRANEVAHIRDTATIKIAFFMLIKFVCY
jgi:hypothetical protein